MYCKVLYGLCTFVQNLNEQGVLGKGLHFDKLSAARITNLNGYTYYECLKRITNSS